MKNLFLGPPALLVVAAIAACGGGGGTVGTETVAKLDSTNSSAQRAGTYVLACKGRSYYATPDATTLTKTSDQGALTVTPVAGSTDVEVSINSRSYEGSADCSASTLTLDVTAKGRLSDKNLTKNYTDGAGNTHVAKVATFTYTDLTLSTGNVSGSLPTFGTTTDIAYVIDGNKLYVSKGRRQADGLGDALSDAATKQ